jgi:serine/threonine-protein kinase
MELDDLKAIWSQIDLKLEQQNARLLRLDREKIETKGRATFRPLLLGQLVQLLFGAIVIVSSARFWSSHLDQISLVISAMVMQAYGVLCIIFAARTIYLARDVDYSASVVTIQRRLAELRRFLLIGTAVIGLSWWVLWIPALAVVMGVLGVNIFAIAPVGIASQLAFCFAGMIASFALYHWLKKRGRETAIEDTFTGSSFRRAQRALDEIIEFERE